MAARVTMETRWKIEGCLSNDNWKDKMDEYSMMAKLANYINKRSFLSQKLGENFTYCYDLLNGILTISLKSVTLGTLKGTYE